MESFKCEECNVEFKEQENLNSHKANVHLIKKHHCDTCKKDFASNASLKSHKKFVHKENLTEDLKCDICNKTLSRKDHLRTHKKNVHKVQNTNSEDLKCDVCNKTFSRKDHLKNHKSAVHEKFLNHACKSCDKKFSSYLQLYNHIRDDHEKDKNKEIEPKNDGSEEKMDENLESKENIQSLEEPKGIKIESEENFTEENLGLTNTEGTGITHEENANKTEDKKSEKTIENEQKFPTNQYSCQICNKNYSKRVHLKRHYVANHPNDHQSKFIKNEDSSREKVGLEFDATKQSPEPKFEKICDKMFSTSEDLCNHIRIDHEVPEYKGIGSFFAKNYICKLEAHSVEI